MVLEKLIVEATQPDSRSVLGRILGRNSTWLHVSMPDYEILSRRDWEETLAVAKHLADSLATDKRFVPESHLAPLVTPMSFIVFDHATSKAMEALIPNSFDVVDSPDFGIYHNRFGMAAGGIDISDADTHCAVQNRQGTSWPWAGGGLGRGPIPTGLLFQISQCAPALPLWYQYGFVGPCGLLRMVEGSNHIILAKATWLSEAETNTIITEAKKNKLLPKLPAIEELFRRRGDGPGNSLTDWPSPAWMAEAALFLRWGLYSDSGNKHGLRSKFETFAERSRTEPVTEAMFRECFGFGYAEMQSQLGHYLIEAGRKPVLVDDDSLVVHANPTPRPKQSLPATLACREATPSEIARLLGDWERMEGKAKRVSDPALSRLYLKRAGKTLHECYDNGERDPRFLAVLGLYDSDVGATAEARSMLAIATEAGVARPTAFVTLAQLNFDEALAHPGTEDGKFNAQQTATVLKPLFDVRKRARLESAGYLLIAEVWLHSVEKPSLRNLAVLQEGMELYPFDSALGSAVGRVYAQWGYVAEVRTLIDQRLKFVDAATAKQLVDLEASLKAGR